MLSLLMQRDASRDANRDGQNMRVRASDEACMDERVRVQLPCNPLAAPNKRMPNTIHTRPYCIYDQRGWAQDVFYQDQLSRFCGITRAVCLQRLRRTILTTSTLSDLSLFVAPAKLGGASVPILLGLCSMDGPSRRPLLWRTLYDSTPWTLWD